MPTEYKIAFCTCPTFEVAQNLARNIVSQKLAACINIIPQLTSIYEWEGKVTQGQEVLLKIKTHDSKLSALQQYILEKHPYDFPEFIVVSIDSGNEQYLNWVQQVVT